MRWSCACCANGIAVVALLESMDRLRQSTSLHILSGEHERSNASSRATPSKTDGTSGEYDLGYFDDETCRLEPIDNPFGPKVLPMSPE